MPAHTESRIRELVAAALAATTEADVDKILPELRSALHEHIQLAKASLEAQALTTFQRPAIRLTNHVRYLKPIAGSIAGSDLHNKMNGLYAATSTGV